jgi:hypothetical protein
MYAALRGQSGEDPREVYNDAQALLTMQMEMQQEQRQHDQGQGQERQE